MGLLDRVSEMASSGPRIVTCRECTKRNQIPDDAQLYPCSKCGSPLAEYPNHLADEGWFRFNNGVNKWKGTSGPHAGIDSHIRSVAEQAAIGVITGRIMPTVTFDMARRFVKKEDTAARSEHMGGLRVFWWAVFFISIPVGIFAPPFLCFSVISILLAIESGTQREMADVVLIAASKHPQSLAEEGACFCYLKEEELLLAFVWKGHLIDINTAVHHRSDAYLEVNWTGVSVGSHDNSELVPVIEAVMRYPGRQRKVVMLSHTYASKESAEQELESLVASEEWYPVLGATFR